MHDYNQFCTTIYIVYELAKILSLAFIRCGKVHIFWEGHKILRNLHRRFDRYYIGQIYNGDFAKICSLLRIYELYHPLKAITFLSLHFLATVGLEGQKCQLFSLQISGCFMLMSGWHTIKFGLIHWADALPNFWLCHHGPNCRRYQPQKQSTLLAAFKTVFVLYHPLLLNAIFSEDDRFIWITGIYPK